MGTFIKIASLIFLCSTLARGQGFGTFANDQPFLSDAIPKAGSTCGLPTPTLFLQVKASVGVTNNSGAAASDGDPVKIWADQTANHFNLTQLGGPSVCPTYHSAGGASNNSPWINFTGSGAMMLSNLTAAASQTNTYIWVWLDYNGGVSSGTRWIMDSGTGTGNRMYYDHFSFSWHMNAGNDYAIGFPWDPNNSVPVVRYNITAMVYAGTNSIIMQDGVIVTAGGNAGTGNQPGVVIGNGFNGTVPAALGLVEWRWYTGGAFCSNDLYSVLYGLATNYNLTALPGL